MTARSAERVRRLVGTAMTGALALASPAMAQDGGDSVWRVRTPTDSMPDAAMRWRILRHNTLTSRGAVFRTVMPAVIGQATDTPHEWNATLGGFGHRVAARAAVVTTRDVLQAGTAAAFGHDPRYQRCDCSGVVRRTGHALAAIVLLRDSRGAARPDPANVVAALGSGAVSAAVYPGSGSREQRVAQRAGLMLGQRAIEHTFLEFAPDVKAWFRRRRHK